MKAQKLTVMMRRVHNRPGYIALVYRIGVMREGMHGFHRRIAKQQQRGKPQRGDNMKYPADHRSRDGAKVARQWVPAR